MMEVVGMGNALMDVLLQLPSDEVLERIGLPKGVMEIVSEAQMVALRKEQSWLSQVEKPGGAACNTVRALSRLGVKTGFIGKIGTDASGRYYEEAVRNAGVTPFFMRTKGISGSCTVLISPDGERTMATFLGPAAAIQAEELSAALFPAEGYLYIEGYLTANAPLMRTAMTMAHRKGAKVALDLANFHVVNTYKSFLEETVPQEVDILFCNETEASAFTGMEAEAAAKYLGGVVQIAVVTVGKDGAWIASGGETVHVDACSCRPIDTTGAGDHFAAGFLYGQTVKATLEQSGRLGALLAGYAVSVIGTEIPEAHWGKIRNEAAGIVQV
jgi:sugar/nucleoside kinase (ribokinase family)